MIPLHKTESSNQVNPAPFLRWAGSKRKLLPKLTPYWRKEFGRYIEPFAGSSALFFALRPDSAVLSDTNGQLIAALEVVREMPELVHAALVSIDASKEVYYAIRSQDPIELTRFDAAVRFIYLNRFCFNGLYRTNLAGEFNVPYAASGTGGIPNLELFMADAALLKNAILRVGDFETIVRQEARAGDFVYLDPPYAVGNRRIFKQYGPHTFGRDDLERLRLLLIELDNRGTHFLLSYASCTETTEFFSFWNRRRVYTQRNIAGFSKHRRRAAETIITNIDADPRRV